MQPEDETIRHINRDLRSNSLNEKDNEE